MSMRRRSREKEKMSRKKHFQRLWLLEIRPPSKRALRLAITHDCVARGTSSLVSRSGPQEVHSPVQVNMPLSLLGLVPPPLHANGQSMPTLPVDSHGMFATDTAKHDCLTFGLGPRAPITDMRFLTRVAEKHVTADDATTSKQLMAYITSNYGASINYLQAYHCIRNIRESTFGNATASYGRLKCVPRSIKVKDPAAVTAFETGDGDAFDRLFLSPSAAINVFMGGGQEDSGIGRDP